MIMMPTFSVFEGRSVLVPGPRLRGPADPDPDFPCRIRVGPIQLNGPAVNRAANRIDSARDESLYTVTRRR